MKNRSSPKRYATGMRPLGVAAGQEGLESSRRADVKRSPEWALWRSRKQGASANDQRASRAPCGVPILDRDPLPIPHSNGSPPILRPVTDCPQDVCAVTDGLYVRAHIRQQSPAGPYPRPKTKGRGVFFWSS